MSGDAANFDKHATLFQGKEISAERIYLQLRK